MIRSCFCLALLLAVFAGGPAYGQCTAGWDAIIGEPAAGGGTDGIVYDIVSFFPRTSSFDWSFLYQPVLSTSAILFLLVGLQLLLLGLVADAILRRIAQHDKPLVPSRGVATTTAALPHAETAQTL